MNNLNLYVKGEVKKQMFLQNISTRQLAQMCGMKYLRIQRALRHDKDNFFVISKICSVLNIDAGSVTKETKPVANTHELIGEVHKQMYIQNISISELALKMKWHYSTAARYISGYKVSKFCAHAFCELFDIPWEGD